MEIDKIAHNLYKKQAGRFLIYEMEGRRFTFSHKGRRRSVKISSVKRDVFNKKIILTGEGGGEYDFREPTFITKDGDSYVFNYLTEDEDRSPLREKETVEHSVRFSECARKGTCEGKP